MADNSTLPVSGGGTEIFANDDVSGVKYPRTKSVWGPDGTANDTDVASGKPLPVQVRSATGLVPIGEPTDAKSTATDTTSASGISIWKQISASVQAIATSIAGALSLASQGYSAAVTLTRTSDTNAYAANDVLGAATGSTAALTFASMGPSAGRIMITSASLEIDASAVISGETSYDLHLYNVTPPSALGDNAAFDLPSGDRASYLGKISLGTPLDLGSTLYIESNAINKQLKLAGTSLFAYLVTNGAHTPTSARVYVVTLHAVSL